MFSMVRSLRRPGDRGRSAANLEFLDGRVGYGIRQDDFVCDVIGVFEDLLKAGESVADATKAVKSQFGAAIEDSDDGPLFWLALSRRAMDVCRIGGGGP